MFLVHHQIFFRVQQGSQELVRGLEVVKSAQGGGILHPGIVSIKGHKIGNPHILQFFQSIGTVQGFPAVPFMLSALVQKGHDYVDPMGFAPHGSNDPLQVLVMVIGRHMVGITVHFICNAVIAHIHQQEQIFASDGFMECTFGFSRSETGTVCKGKVIAFDIAVKGGIVFHFFIVDTAAEFHQIIIDPAAHPLCGGQGDQLQRRHRHCVFQLS